MDLRKKKKKFNIIKFLDDVTRIFTRFAKIDHCKLKTPTQSSPSSWVIIRLAFSGGVSAKKCPNPTLESSLVWGNTVGPYTDVSLPLTLQDFVYNVQEAVIESRETMEYWNCVLHLIIYKYLTEIILSEFSVIKVGMT